MSDIFKSLPDMELIECLEHFCNFAVPHEIIKNPTPAFLKTVMQMFLTDWHVNVEAMEVMPWNDGALAVEHKELYETMPMFVFFTVARRFMLTAGLPDFNLKDLLDPKPKRTRKLLTVLISFWKYILSMKKRFEEVEFELQSEIGEEKRILELNEKLNEKYLNLMKTKVDPEKKKELLMARKSSKLDEVLQAKNAINEEYQVLKTNIAIEEKRGSELDVMIISEKEKIEDLNNRILKSPQRITSDLEELKGKILECDNKILEFSKKKEEKMQGLAALATSMENLNKFKDLCKELEESREMLMKEASVIDEKQRESDELALKDKTLSTKLNAISESMSLSEQKWAQMELQSKMQVEGQKKILEVNQCGLEKELAITASLERTSAELDQGNAMLTRKKESISNKIEEVSEEIAEKCLQKQAEFEEHMRVLTNELTHALKIAKNAKI